MTEQPEEPAEQEQPAELSEEELDEAFLRQKELNPDDFE